MTDEMTDEQYGRDWAARTGRAPHRVVHEDGWAEWCWHRPGVGGFDPGPSVVPAPVSAAIAETTAVWFASEAEAFAALGRAVRLVHEQVPR